MQDREQTITEFIHNVCLEAHANTFRRLRATVKGLPPEEKLVVYTLFRPSDQEEFNTVLRDAPDRIKLSPTYIAAKSFLLKSYEDINVAKPEERYAVIRYVADLVHLLTMLKVQPSKE